MNSSASCYQPLSQPSSYQPLLQPPDAESNEQVSRYSPVFKARFGKTARESLGRGELTCPCLAPTWDLVGLSFPRLSGSAESSGSSSYLLSCSGVLHPPPVNDEVRVHVHQAGRDADVSHLLAPRAVSWSGKGMRKQGNKQHTKGEALWTAQSLGGVG